MSAPDSAFAMIVEFHAAENCREELARELLLLVAPTRAEAGCTRYDLHVDVADRDTFVFYETWSSKAAHAAHDASAHVARIRAALPRLVRQPPRMQFLAHREP